jgi:hypothetical protein
MNANVSVSEKAVGQQCDDLATRLGWTVDRLEQRRATTIVRGLPDRRYHRPGQRIWIELKKPGGRLTADQHAWLLSELDAGALATVIDDVHQLARLFHLLARRSSSLESAAREYCRDLVQLCWRRGPRREAR